MFFQNLGYAWTVAPGATSAIFRASGQDSAGALRRGRPALKDDVLFDPQLYLLDFDLTPEGHGKLLSNLATYPWFLMDAPTYDSGDGRRIDWAADRRQNIGTYWSRRGDPHAEWIVCVRSAVQFQLQFGVSAVVLPATLIADPETTLEADLDRLDTAIQVASELTDLPLYASLPIDEGAVRHRNLGQNTLVDALVDSVSAREGIAGVYVPVSQSAPGKDRITNQRVAAALMQISRKLGVEVGLRVIVNFTESLGLLCCSIGAYGYGTGYSQKGRRLCFADLKEGKGGAPLPKFFSLATLMDYYPERDLEKLQAHRLLRYFRSDRTAASINLLEALRAGQRSASVAPWEERRANKAAAELHYSALHARAGAEPLSSDDALAWLQQAEESWAYLSNRFREDPLEAADGRHLTPWRAAFEEVLNSD